MPDDMSFRSRSSSINGSRRASLLARKEPDVRVGDRVTSLDGTRVGTARYVGNVGFKVGRWVGIELDEGLEGKNNGTVQDKTYFVCDENRGVFLPLANVELVDGPRAHSGASSSSRPSHSHLSSPPRSQLNHSMVASTPTTPKGSSTPATSGRLHSRATVTHLSEAAVGDIVSALRNDLDHLRQAIAEVQTSSSAAATSAAAAAAGVVARPAPASGAEADGDDGADAQAPTASQSGLSAEAEAGVQRVAEALVELQQRLAEKDAIIAERDATITELQREAAEARAKQQSHAEAKAQAEQRADLAREKNQIELDRLHGEQGVLNSKVETLELQLAEAQQETQELRDQLSAAREQQATATAAPAAVVPPEVGAWENEKEAMLMQKELLEERIQELEKEADGLRGQVKSLEQDAEVQRDAAPRRPSSLLAQDREDLQNLLTAHFEQIQALKNLQHGTGPGTDVQAALCSQLDTVLASQLQHLTKRLTQCEDAVDVFLSQTSPLASAAVSNGVLINGAEDTTPPTDLDGDEFF
ncbi:uncharacterized protein MONBRDRAFT_12256 [Monosiga brevicollis MX1]|uniref:CAP-Gly domain-containing protein n=1 Tax=Monosiga brevicollis TaxID=81824 RepID=A9VBP7_MONBE|nr:uncharacterized protein MONBRDRAFT_12256 [Monosiga brevicollis MX1]EDQ85014.1 predicted protein [Monosiga brevicollis MX1]|eukprot:XP_001750184.1 hypothetical protein [Monosiga brevicollis MX1]